MTTKKLPYHEWKAVNKIILIGIQDRYPGVFDPDNPVPLKIGIHKDMFQVFPELSKEKTKGFLRWWTRRNKYKPGRIAAEAGESPRYDLWGNECDPGPVKINDPPKTVAASEGA